MSDRSNDEWLRDLRKPAPDNEPAIRDLRDFVVRKLDYLLARGRKNQGDIVEDIAQETIVKALASLSTFRGESRFTTWAARIAINLAYSELRRRRWSEVSIEVMPAESITIALDDVTARSDSPEQRAIKSSIVAALQRAMTEELTDYQRQVLIATMSTRMPMGEVARRFGTNRNALYKVLHDARRKLKKTLIEGGLTADDIRSLF